MSPHTTGEAAVDVRGRGHHGRARRDGGRGHLGASVEVRGAVVEPGQDVGMEVDHVRRMIAIR